MEERDLADLPPIDQLYAYAMDKVHSVQVDTVLQYVTLIVKGARRVKGTFLESPTEEYDYKMLFANMKRLYSAEDNLKKKAKKLPITPEVLAKIVDVGKSFVMDDALSEKGRLSTCELEFDERDFGEILACIFVVLYAGCMRVDELIGATDKRPGWKNTRFSDCGRFAWISLPTRKTSSYAKKTNLEARIIGSFPCDPVGRLAWLCNNAQRCGRRALIPNVFSTHQSSFPRLFKRALRGAEVDLTYTPHCFRVGGAELLFKSGASIQAIMRSAGWSGREVLDRYISIRGEENIEQVHAQVESFQKEYEQRNSQSPGGEKIAKGFDGELAEVYAKVSNYAASGSMMGLSGLQAGSDQAR